jgi:hypothetical protein
MSAANDRDRELWAQYFYEDFPGVIDEVVRIVLWEGIENVEAAVRAYAEEALSPGSAAITCSRAFHDQKFIDRIKGYVEMERTNRAFSMKRILASSIARNYIPSRVGSELERLAYRKSEARKEKKIATQAAKQKKADKYYRLQKYVDSIDPMTLEKCSAYEVEKVKTPGIYFLFVYGEGLVYIGSSVNIGKRVTASHPVVKKIGMHHIAVHWFKALGCNRDLEALLIEKFNPRCNMLNGIPKGLPLPTALQP